MRTVNIDDFYGKPLILSHVDREYMFFECDGKYYRSWEGLVTEIPEEQFRKLDKGA